MQHQSWDKNVIDIAALVVRRRLRCRSMHQNSIGVVLFLFCSATLNSGGDGVLIPVRVGSVYADGCDWDLVLDLDFDLQVGLGMIS